MVKCLFREIFKCFWLKFTKWNCSSNHGFSVNPLMHNSPKNGQRHFKNIAAFAAKSLKCFDHFKTLCIKGLDRQNVPYNFINLQEFQPERKRTVFYGLETLSHSAPRLGRLFLEEIKQTNTISLFKRDVKQLICKEWPCRLCRVFVPNVGFIWHMAPILVLLSLKLWLFLTRVFMIHLTERQMFNNNNRSTSKTWVVILC